MAGTFPNGTSLRNAAAVGDHVSSGPCQSNGADSRAGVSDPRVRLDQFLEGLEPYSSIEVYVSPADRSGWPINIRRFLHSVESTLLTVSSGTNRRRTVSKWKNAEGRVLLERTVVVQSYVPAAAIDRLLTEVLPELQRIARREDQECLLVVIDGRPLFLSLLDAPHQNGVLPGVRRA